MLKLIKKDFMFGRNSLLINFLLLLVFGGVMFKISILDIWLLIIIVYIAIFVISPITIEDKLKTDSLMASMPLNRSLIVNSRYLFGILIIIFVTFFMLSYGYVLDRFITANYIDYSNVFTFSRVFSMIFFSVVLVSLLIPVVYRFGQSGMMIGLAGSVLLSTVLFMITALGIKSTILNRVLGGFFERVEGGGLSSFFTAISVNIGPLFAVLVLTGIMVVLVFISMRVSLFVYTRKEF
ncbi:ABC-2 transporter permease [Actinomycetota bacterium]